MQGRILIMLAALAAVWPGVAASETREEILEGLAAEARLADPGFSGFSAARGNQLFTAKHTGGKDDTPSCTTCHGENPQDTGKTRAGKPIEPMAVSKTPARYTDPKKLEKWFGRNCDGVLGRECTALERGDFITYMMRE